MSVEPLPVRVKRTLRMGPVETLTVARRQMDARLAARIDRTRQRIAPRLARIGAGRDDAIATYFAVLDGHTLNLQAKMPPLEVRGAAVIFRKGRTERRAAATVNGPYVEATAVLGAGDGRIPLARGTWRVRIEVTGPTGKRRTLDLHRLVPEPHRAGPTITDPACPDTGTKFRAGTSSLGACRIVVRPARPGAEVSRLLVEAGRAEIVGRLVGVPDATGAVGEFYRRGAASAREVPITVRGDVFRIAAPLAAMVPAPDAEDIWEVRIRLAGDRRLPVGRFLHDLRSVRRTLRAYERQMLVPGAPLFHLRPQYSNAGRLTLTCTSVDTGDQA